MEILSLELLSHASYKVKYLHQVMHITKVAGIDVKRQESTVNGHGNIPDFSELMCAVYSPRK